MVVEPLLDKGEVARRLGVSQRAVERYIDDAGLPVIRVTARTFRFDWSAVQAWLAARTEELEP